jgi:hypothetical protein
MTELCPYIRVGLLATIMARLDGKAGWQGWMARLDGKSKTTVC